MTSLLTRLVVRPLRPDDDLEAELDLRRRAFGPISSGRRASWVASIQGSIEAGALFGAFDGGGLIGSARYHIMRQWWHGRSLPMAGVGGVKVAPEERGRGVGSALMAALLGGIADSGYPVSMLFPTTAPIYRAHGWEIAGRRYETVVPARALSTFVGPDMPELTASSSADGAAVATVSTVSNMRRATPADAEAIVAVKSLVHSRLRHCGPSTREPWVLHDWLDNEDRFAYLADDGFLSYRWSGDMEELEIEELIAASADTARAFWRIVASNAHMARRVRACLAPEDPVTWLTREPGAELHQSDVFMLRVVDAPAAIAGRGFPTGTSVSVPLDLSDPARPANSGRWLLDVAEGTGALSRLGANSSAAGERAALCLGARGFAALYAGVPLPTLRLAGLASGGDPAADDALTAAFCGPAFTNDHF